MTLREIQPPRSIIVGAIHELPSPLVYNQKVMLSKRIIPCLDVDRGRVVKGVSFVNLRDAGDPREMSAFYNTQGADELVFLDITASHEQRDTIVEVVKQVSEEVFIPLTVGGGIRTPEDVRKMLNAGADKCSFNSAAVENPQVIADAAAHFGNQCIVVAIDARGYRPGQSRPTVDAPYSLDATSKWEVYTHGGRRPTGIDAVKWARYVNALGAGEILLTSMDTDGHQTGYDIPLTRAVSEAVTIPVIASGGAGKPQDFYDAFVEGKADAALAASIFHYGQVRIADTKRYLAQRGIPIRLEGL